MRSLLSMATLALVTLAFDLGPSSARSQEADVAGALVGTYQNVAPDGGRASIEEGTDAALAEAGLLVRALARPRILENNPPVRRLTIEVEGAMARVTYEGLRTYRGPIGRGPALEQRAPDGSDVRVRYLIERRALVEIAEADQGTGRIRYELRGGELVVGTVIASARLPSPIRFSMRFARSTGARRVSAARPQAGGRIVRSTRPSSSAERSGQPS